MPKPTIDPAALASNPRASISAWLKYSHIVTAAYAQHPRPYTFTPQNSTAYSTSTKIRDAIRGQIAFNYPCEIKPEALARWWEEVVVTCDKNSVTIGPKPSKTEKPIAVTTPSQDVYTYESLSLGEINAFELLLSNGRIRGPVTINNPPDVSMLVQPSNVERITRPDGKLILL